MKQKYSVVRNDEKGVLVIQEYAELSKEIFTLVCEETYPRETIEKAVSQGLQAVIDTIRTPNLYPISTYAAEIAKKVMDLYSSTDNPPETSAELLFDDIELVAKPEPDGETEQDDVQLDDILEEPDTEEPGE